MVFCLTTTKVPRWLAQDSEYGLPTSEKRAQPLVVDDGPTAAERAMKDAALADLRHLMEDRKLDVYVVPSEDEHLSEYPSPADRRLKFITGFTGSAGTAIITRSTALLYVDSRYWVQAPSQVSSSWTVKRVGEGEQRDWATDLIKSEDGLTRVGIDPRLISAAASGTHSASVTTLLAAPNLSVVPIMSNLVDMVWPDRPARSSSLVNLHSLEFAGKRSAVKIKELVQSDAFKVASTSAEGFFVSGLDEIAWLLNLRGTDDVPMTPVFYAYLWVAIDTDSAVSTLFIDLAKISPEVADYLASLNIRVKPYADVWPFLEGLKSETLKISAKATSKKAFTSQALSWAVQLALGKENILSIPSPVTDAKAIKNETEISGFQSAYLRDGRATVRWMARMEALIKKEGREVDEHEATVLYSMYRSKEKHYSGPAYGDISGSGPNGALPHYEPVKGKCRIIDRKTPYVNDSGPQYLDGTIDTTRTLHFGSPTKEQKRAYTRVLQGHLTVMNQVFPEGKSGRDLDVLARSRLWEDRLNFSHGTGHGIGSYGGVHEGPQSFSSLTPLKPGHVISCEPGYYKEGHFGIRIESALVCVEVEKGWLGWKLLTRAPIATNLVDHALLSPTERQWLKDHNELCKREIMPLLEGREDAEARKWLKRQ